jgi:hypothetical protein
MEEKVLHILRTVLEDNTLEKNCSQENCEAWDSLHHLNICFELEQSIYTRESIKIF